jgi:GNAT superfamily N-acetyltransferase
MSEALTFREIVRDDIHDLATAVADAFMGYHVFAPAGWEPPPASEQASMLERWIADADFWGELACEEGALAGHATFIPARRSLRAAPDPSLAHLGHLFVKPEYWGSSVAGELLARAVEAAITRGFARMRLFVPVGQARARRFYAREGFAAVGEPFEFGLGLPALEYRRSLSR